MLRRHQHDRAGHTLAAIYREHATAAYRYAVHLSGSREDADDLVQAAFLEAHRHLVQGGAIVNPRAWLATVVRTRASNLRRDRREAAASDRLETLAGALREDAGEAREALDRVRAVLYELPEAQHQAFVLRYWSDLSYREIAAVLDTTESAVESLLVRARAAIVSGQDVADDCLDVRRHLSADSLPSTVHMRHLDDCARCRAARERLARAAGIAAALALVPRIHVAQALGATVPGFTAAAATGTTATVGGSTLAAGKAGLAAKTAIAALALAGSAALVHTHLHRHDRAAAAPARWFAPAFTESAHRVAPTANGAATSAAPVPAVDHSAHEHMRNRDRDPSADGAGGETVDGSQTDATQGQDASSDGNSQGEDQSTGDSGAGSGDAGGGDSQGSGGGQDGSSQDGGSSGGGSGNDNP